MRYFFLYIYFLITYSISLAQYDSTFIKQNIINLSSEDYFGRGAYKDGDTKASKYIDTVLKKLQITDIQRQAFRYESNLFKKAILQQSDKKPILGLHYLPHPFSGSGRFKIQDILNLHYGLLIDDEEINSRIVYIKKDIDKEFLNINKINDKEANLFNRLYQLTQKGVKSIFLEVLDFEFSYSHFQFDIPIIQVKNFDVNQQYYLHLENEKPYKKESFNLMASIDGENNDSTIVLMAHYDHLGAITDEVFFPGANDNASGTSLLLNLAKTIVQKPLKYRTIFLFFAAEEVGLVGSKHFVNNPLIDLSKIKIAINFDMVASAENGRMIQAGIEFPDIYNQLVNINNELSLGKIAKRKNKANSDQFHFIENGVKAIFIYTNGGKQPYHSLDDKYQTLDYDELEKTYRLVETFLYRFY
jgi:aminopeptidase YwaD